MNPEPSDNCSHNNNLEGLEGGRWKRDASPLTASLSPKPGAFQQLNGVGEGDKMKSMRKWSVGEL